MNAPLPPHRPPATVDDDSFAEMLEALRRFVWAELVPHERALEQSGTVPRRVFEQMAELGIFGLSIAAEYGGLGLSPTQEAQVHMVLSETAQGFRYPYGTNVGIGSRAIALAGTDAQKTAYLPRLASGELISAFCATEPDAGSDLAGLKTRAVRDADGEHYLINGSKRFITNADIAGLFTVLARTGESDSGSKGVSAFLVERATPGLSVGVPERKLGQHGGSICDVHFDAVRVHRSQIIGGDEGRGFLAAMLTLDAGRITVAANCIGQMRRAIDEASRFALERKQFGQPIAQFQLIQALLADSQTDWYAARLCVLDAAAALERNGVAKREAACAKYFCSEALGRVADRCLQVLGGSGYLADYPLERIYRDARVARIYEGTSQIMQLVIARELLRDYA